MRRLVCAACVVVAVLVPSAGGTPPNAGFVTVAGLTDRKVVCAVGLPRLLGLFCASPAIKANAYDGRGVVRLMASGRVEVRLGGSDVLLAIDGNLPEAPRPLLPSGQTWREAGHTCTNRRGTVTCNRKGHGFVLSPTRFRRF